MNDEMRMRMRKFQICNEVWDMEIQEGVSRIVTNKILMAIEDGMLDRDTVIMACLKYMSEAEVADMADANELFCDDEDDIHDVDDDYEE